MLAARAARARACTTRSTGQYDNEFRRDYTLDQMAKYGYIPQSEAARLKALKCCGIPKSQKDEDARISRPAGSEYFVE